MKSRPENRQMRITCVHSDGTEETSVRTIPPPDKIDSRALDQIGEYVARLVQSSSPKISLIIASPNGKKACLIHRDQGQLKVREHIHLAPSGRIANAPFHSPTGLWRLLLKLVNLPTGEPEPEKELAVRLLFAELAIAPDMDFVHDYNGYADAMRDLSYPMGNDVSQATMVIQRLLREVYHVRDTDGLHFTMMD